MSRTSRYRKATPEEISKITYIGFKLDELFTDEQIEDILTIARLAVAGEFEHAMEFNPRYRLGHSRHQFVKTDNYIIGCDGRPAKLARLVVEKTHRQIVHKDQLSAKPTAIQLTQLNPKFVELIVARARYDAVLAAINIMIKVGEIWYREDLGIWNVIQSTIDEYNKALIFRKEVKRALKFDDHSWHGLPRRDRNRKVHLA